jgi:hypothetical protein
MHVLCTVTLAIVKQICLVRLFFNVKKVETGAGRDGEHEFYKWVV